MIRSFGCCSTVDEHSNRLPVYQRLSGDSSLAFCPLSGCPCPEVVSGHLEREVITATDTHRLEVLEHALSAETVEVRESFARDWSPPHKAHCKDVIVVPAPASLMHPCGLGPECCGDVRKEVRRDGR